MRSVQGGLGAYNPSYEIVGATSSENNDVHRLTVQLLDKCPDLALLGTSKDCASAPVGRRLRSAAYKTGTTNFVPHRAKLQARSDLLRSRRSIVLQVGSE